MKLPSFLTQEVKVPSIKRKPKPDAPAKASRMARRPGPKLSKPSLVKAPSVKAPSVKPPKVLSDLGRDMRDRRLIVPAIALVVAIIAVPIALSSSSTPPPPSAPVATPVDASAVEPAVSTQQLTGVRDYRKRIRDRKQQNPFQALYPKTHKKKGSGASDVPPTVSTPAAESPSSATVSSSPAVDAGTGTSPTDTGVPSDVTAPPTTDTSSGNGGHHHHHHHGSGSGAHWFTYEVDLKVGPLGDGRTARGVGTLDVVPSAHVPAAILNGVSDQGTTALFSISSKVDRVGGTGRCIGRTDGTCQYVSLKRGKAMTLHYAPRDRTYRVKLDGIRVVKLHHPPGSASSGK